ncbi:MAG: PDZ domain-containing protein [Bacteroidota bacterium]
MKSAKFCALLLLCLFSLHATAQKRVTVSVTQETDRGTITIDTSFVAEDEVDLDRVLERLEMSSDAREERIVIRSDQGQSRTIVVNQDGASRSANRGKVTLGVYLGHSTNGGVKINSVTNGGAAQRAGLRGGDILTKVGNYPTRSEADVVKAKTYLSPDEPVRVEFLRDGDRRGATLYFNQAKKGKVTLGVYLGSSQDGGVRISSVTSNGAAKRAGVRGGDVLLKVGDYRVRSEQDVVKAKTFLSPDEPVEIEYKRGEQYIASVLYFNENGNHAHNDHDYDYDYDYDYDHDEEDEQWDWDRDESNSWEADEDVASRAFLGVYSEDVDEDLADDLGLPDVYGVYVDGVVDNSAAEDAGLQEGDVIVGFDNDDIPTAEALRAYLGSLEPGTRIRIGYYRDGRLQRTTATLGRTQSSDNSWQPEGRRVTESKPYLGVYLEDIRGDGVRITKVVENSSADRAGLRRGDILVELDGKDIDDYDDLKRVMNEASAGENVRIEFIRDGDRERTRATLGAKKVERWEKP